MLVMLLFGGFVLVGVGLCIHGSRTGNDADIAGIIMLMIFGLALLFGAVACLDISEFITLTEARLVLQMEINHGLWRAEAISEFNTNLLGQQAAYKSPWTSWFYHKGVMLIRPLPMPPGY